MLCGDKGILLLALSVSTVAEDQRGCIAGTLSDAAGKPLPWVVLTATNQKNKVRFSANTGSDGALSFCPLPAGIYDIQTEQDGFQTTLGKGVESLPGSALKLSLILAGLPDRLLSAKTIYVVVQTPERSENARREFNHWGRYTVVDRLDDADLVVVFGFIRSLQEYDSAAQWTGCCVPSPPKGRKVVHVRMTVYDRYSRQWLYRSPDKGFGARWNWAFSKPAKGLIDDFRKKLERIALTPQ